MTQQDTLIIQKILLTFQKYNTRPGKKNPQIISQKM
jgi:hypothetical protein